MNKHNKKEESAALLLLSLRNTEDVNERKPLRYCRWTTAEDRLLAQLVKKKYGTWKKIAARIPGRTVRQTRSRWLKLCKKYQLALRGKQEHIDGRSTTTTTTTTNNHTTFSPPEFMQDSDEDEDCEQKLLAPLRHNAKESRKLPSLLPYLGEEEDTSSLPHEEMLQILYASKNPVRIPIADRVITAYQCLYPACNRIFKSRTFLNEHVIVHGYKFECKQCRKSFNSKEPLEMHLIDHDIKTNNKY